MFLFLKKGLIVILLTLFSSHLFADAQDDAIEQTNQFSELYLDFKESILDKLEFGKLGLSEEIELIKAYDGGKKRALEKAVSDIKDQWGDINNMDSNIDAVINPASDHGLPRSYISLRTTVRNIQNGFEKMEELRVSFAPKLIEEIDMSTILTKKRDGFGFDELKPNLYAEQLDKISSIIEDVSLIEKSIEDYQSSLNVLAERRKGNIKNVRFPEGHVAITVGDPDELADSIKQWFKESPGWGQKAENPYDILAVAITRDWVVMKRSILDETIQYGLPIKVALQTDKDKQDDLARVFNITILTNIEKGITKSPPWANAAVGTSQFILVENLGHGASSSSSSGGIGALLWLALSLLAIISGFIASKSFLEDKHPLLTQSYQHLSSFSTLIGVVAVSIAVASFAYSTLSLNILAGIIPQLLVAVTGLLLGKELIMKKIQAGSEDVANLAATQEVNLNKISVYQGTLGLATLSIGVVYLISAGSFYII